MSACLCSIFLRFSLFSLFFFFNDTATTEIYTLPYTTLFRSRSGYNRQFVSTDGGVAHTYYRLLGPQIERDELIRRSEEHTSELQSHLNLVCRLLLEKKKKRSIELVNNYLYEFAGTCQLTSVV